MSYTPNESPAQLVAEEAWLAGALITGTGYGIVLALFLLCCQALWNRLKHRDVNSKRNLFFLAYVCVMFVFGSLFLGSNSQFTQLAFINNRGYPGGPSQYEEQMFSISVDEISNVSYVLANWLADSLLVWRCVIIYRDFGALSGHIVLIITGLMQLASYGERRDWSPTYLGGLDVMSAHVIPLTVLGVFFLMQISAPSSSPYMNAGQPINWTIPYFCVSLAINLVVTLLVVVRLVLYRRAVVQLLGPGHATECTTFVAVLVESAAVYATFSLLFLVPYTLHHPVSYTFLQVLGEAQLIAPLLIIYREAQGKGWISSGSSLASGLVSGDRDIRIGRFTDMEFASGLSYSQSAGTRTLELASKQDQESSRQVAVDTVVEEVSRSREREEIELRAL